MHSAGGDSAAVKELMLSEGGGFAVEVSARHHRPTSVGVMWLGADLGVGQLGEDDWLVPPGVLPDNENQHVLCGAA